MFYFTKHSTDFIYSYMALEYQFEGRNHLFLMMISYFLAQFILGRYFQ